MNCLAASLSPHHLRQVDEALSRIKALNPETQATEQNPVFAGGNLIPP
jgi:hypothetical protein